MKKMLITFSAGLLMTSAAHATGLVKKVYHCNRMAGESATNLIVELLTGAAPGGPVWRQYRAYLTDGNPVTGIRSSGSVDVERSVDESSGVESFDSADGSFALEILQKQLVRPAGISQRIQIQARYFDVNSKEEKSLSPTWLNCQ